MKKTAIKAVISGASSGLGFAIAKLLLENGSEVVNVSRTKTELDCETILTDLSDNNSIIKMIDHVTQNHPDCNLLCQCAGVMHWHATGENPPDIIDNDIAVNLSGMIKTVDGLLPVVKSNNGDIVIIGSTSSFNTPPGSAVYCAAKHGVLGYIKSLQTEFKKENLRIFGIHPGGFNSQFHTRAQTKIDHSTLMDPNEIAQLILSLISLPRNMEVSEIIVNRKEVAA